MATLRVVGVGAGYFSQFHQRGWQAIEQADCVAIVDRDLDRARALAQRHGVPKVYGDLETALGEIGPDLVDIVTPPDTHRELLSHCFARRIPAICQKPFGVDWSEAVALADAAADAGVPLIVHENFRWQPWYREIRRLLDDGLLGSPHSIAFRLRPGDGQGPEAYLSRQPYFQRMQRFLIRETAIHWIDTFRYLLGEVDAVTARLRRINPAIAGEDAGYVIFEFAGGATALFDGNRANDHVASDPRRTMGEMWLEGSAGVMRLDGEARLWFKPHQRDEAEHRYRHGPTDAFGGGACEALQRHVVRHFVDGTALENEARPYLANLRVQEAIYRSHSSGCRIELAGFDPAAP